MNKRGQSAIEFMIIVGTVFFLFIAFLGALASQRTDALFNQRDTELKEIALIMQDEINLAQSSRDGYQRSFLIPYEVSGLAYTINTTGGFVYVRTIDNRHALALPIANVTGFARLGSNTLRKQNSTVLLNLP